MTRSIAVACLLSVVPMLAAPVAAAPPADAPSHSLSPTFLACYQRAGTNIVQRDVCGVREVGAQDDRLNKAYQRVMHQLAADPAARLKLRDEERAWIEERDYTCKINGDTVETGCVVLKTAARADALESRVRF